MKNSSFDYCPCCGYHRRYRAQTRRVCEIKQVEAESQACQEAAGIHIRPPRRPAWKSVQNPRRLDRYVQCANGLGQLTPRQLRQRHKERDIRRQLAKQRKQQRQDGVLQFSR